MEQRLPIKVSTIAIIGMLMVMYSSYSFSQSNSQPQTISASDSSSSKASKTKSRGFLARLFHLSNRNTAHSSTSKKKTKSDSSANKQVHRTEPFEFTKGGIAWTSLYTQGVNLNTGIAGMYSLGRLTQGFDIYGIPMTAVAVGVFNNGEFQRSYSSYSVNFDAQAYMAGLRKRAQNILYGKQAFGEPSSPHSNLNDSLNEYESVRRKITSPSYQADENSTRTKFERDNDSAKKNPNADSSELHSLRKKMAYFAQMEERYGQLFEIKKSYNRISGADTFSRGTESKYENEDKSLNNPDNVEKILSDNHAIKGYEKGLMGLQKFSIGQNGEEISEFTLHNFMMNGVDAAYKYSDSYSEVGYGKQVAVINPYLMTGISVPDYSRSIMFVRTGLGPEDKSNFYATVVRISEPFSSNSLGEDNWVFDLNKKVVVNKNLEFEGEVAKSSFGYYLGTSDNVTAMNTQTVKDFAYALRAKGTLNATNTILKLEYAQVGSDFITLGNSYLINASQLYKAEISQPLGKLFFFTVGGDHIIEKPVGGSSQTDNWMDFSVRFKPTKLISMELKYSPRQLQQQEGTVIANSMTNNINQISYTASMENHIGASDANTSIFIGNFQYMTAESSLLLTQNYDLSYYMMNEIYMFSTTDGLNISMDESRNSWTGNLSQFITQALYTMKVKKIFNVGIGPQWSEQPGVLSNGGGLVAMINATMWKIGRIGLQTNYRNNIDKLFGNEAQWLISGNVSILW